MRKPGCLRAFVCAVCVPASCVCASFVPVACFSTVPLLRSHCHAHTVACGRFLCSRGWWKSRFAVGVFARWVVGFRVYARGVFVWVFACFGVGALVGWWGSVVPPPLITLTALWRVGLWCSRLWCGCGSVCPMGGGRPGRGGTWLSRPYALLVSLPLLRGAWKRKRVWVPARSGEHAHRGREACGVELACSLAWCVQPTGGVKGEVGIGPCRAGLASVRAIVGLGGDWVARLPSWWWGWVGGNDFPR